MKAEKGMSELKKNNPGPDYAHLLAEVKERVRSAQYEAWGKLKKSDTNVYPEQRRCSKWTEEPMAATPRNSGARQ